MLDVANEPLDGRLRIRRQREQPAESAQTLFRKQTGTFLPPAKLDKAKP
jgi:hypothetical protein